MSKKVAVVLFNLGGPDSKNAIRPFLMNFFMDKNIIRVPIPFRCIIAALIANKRSKREAGDSYGELGDCSPLLANTKEQAKALETQLNNDSRETESLHTSSLRKQGSYSKNDQIPDQVGDDGHIEFKAFVCMRYWHPMSPQVVREVRDWGADEIVLLPMYPQFSTTTTWSSLEVWNKAMFEAGLDTPTSMVCCYHANDGFVKASAQNIRVLYDQALKDGYQNPRILFSAHGLPESVIKDGDPYQWQCEQTAEAIVDALGIEGVDWQICYQSRVGPKKWIGPSTQEALEQAAKDGKAVIIYPHAFTQEHVETLVELDIEYREEAEEMGLHGYYRADTVGTHAAFIAGLAGLVHAHRGRGKVEAEGFEAPCPPEFGRCCMREKSA